MIRRHILSFVIFFHGVSKLLFQLLFSSPRVMILLATCTCPHMKDSIQIQNSVWLDNWSASCFWKPVPQPKKTKKSVSESFCCKAPKYRHLLSWRNKNAASGKLQASLYEPPAVKNPQTELEKVERSL